MAGTFETTVEVRNIYTCMSRPSYLCLRKVFRRPYSQGQRHSVRNDLSKTKSFRRICLFITIGCCSLSRDERHGR